MSPPDELLVAISEDGLLRARIARVTTLVGELTLRQRSGRLATLALGRAAGAAAVFPMEAGKLALVSLQFTGGGPLGGLLVEHRQSGDIRGYAQEPTAEPRGTLALRRSGAGLGLLPHGSLSVVKQDGHGRYTVGRVALQNGEIDDDVAGYFRDSEQVPTAIFAETVLDEGGRVTASFAVLVQVLPPADADALLRVPPRFDVEEGTTLEGLLQLTLGDSPRVLERTPLRFCCDCSRDRVARSLLLLEPRELEEMIAQDHGAEVTCRFCAEQYLISEEELEEILRQRRTAVPDEVH
ncbi:MAG: Hsp33 family molecular chaperone HslO [Myxococcota bacterium]